MTQLLLATLGLSPGAVTSAFFALQRAGVRLDQVVTVTTDNLAARACEQMIWETLQETEAAPLYKPLRAGTVADLQHENATEKFTSYLRDLLEEYGAVEEVHLALSGGRTSMAAAAMLAVQQYTFHKPEAARRLRLYHVEVIEEDVEERGKISRLTAMSSVERRYYMDPPDTAVTLVQIPVLNLHDETNALRERLFTYVVGAHVMERYDYQQVRYNFYPDYLQGQQAVGEVDVYAEKPCAGAIEVVEKYDPPKLRTLLKQAFSKQDLRELCSNLRLDYEDFPERKSDFVLELIAYMERHGRLTDLLEECRRARPRHPWQEAVELRQVLLCKCELRAEDKAHNPITVAEVQCLVEQVTAVHTNTRRPVQGWLVSNAPAIDDDARTLALEEGVSVFQAILPAKWKERVDWRIEKDLIPLQQAPTL